MQGTRPDGDYQRIGYIGKNNTGKSSRLLETLYASYDLSVHRVVIFIATDPKVYTGIPRVHTYDKLKALQCGIVKFWDNMATPVQMLEKVITILREGQRDVFRPLQNGAMVFDDCSNYLSTTLPDAIKTFLGDNRHYHLDLYFLAHSIIDFPAALRRRVTAFRIFKTLDSLLERDFKSFRYPNHSNLYRAWCEVMNSPDNYASLSIKTA